MYLALRSSEMLEFTSVSDAYGNKYKFPFFNQYFFWVTLLLLIASPKNMYTKNILEVKTRSFSPDFGSETLCGASTLTSLVKWCFQLNGAFLQHALHSENGSMAKAHLSIKFCVYN